MYAVSLARLREYHRAGTWRMLFRAAIIWAMLGPAVAAETIIGARYAEPVERYGHYALGRPHEYARLSATTSGGREHSLDLPENEVFEDLAPRLIKLAPGEPVAILAIVSGRDSGARLVLIGLDGGRLVVRAQSEAIGTPNRWLNPVGVGDLDGDGRAEIAAVITPHIGGTLKVYRAAGKKLVEVAALAGFSNHVYGTPELALSASLVLSGRTRLLVPDATRTNLRIVALEGGHLVETGRCALSAAIIGPLEQISPDQISVRLVNGRQLLAPKDCGT